jgi:hypothetical protein
MVQLGEYVEPVKAKPTSGQTTMIATMIGALHTKASYGMTCVVLFAERQHENHGTKVNCTVTPINMG